MAFEATKREWGELYAFFRLLADGYVYAGTPDVKRNEVQKLPVAMVQREEHVSIRPRACFFPLFSFLPLWLHYNLNPLCVQY